MDVRYIRRGFFDVKQECVQLEHKAKGIGRFWQSRFAAARILDEESLLACAAYVAINASKASKGGNDHKPSSRLPQTDLNRRKERHIVYLT
jgi:hypothetical protein